MQQLTKSAIGETCIEAQQEEASAAGHSWHDPSRQTLFPKMERRGEALRDGVKIVEFSQEIGRDRDFEFGRGWRTTVDSAYFYFADGVMVEMRSDPKQELAEITVELRQR